jgi:hypothetical protein
VQADLEWKHIRLAWQIFWINKHAFSASGLCTLPFSASYFSVCVKNPATEGTRLPILPTNRLNGSYREPIEAACQAVI